MTVASAAQVAARMSKVGKAVRDSQQNAVTRASNALKDGVLASSPKRLRNVGKSGAKLGVSFKVTGGAHPEAKGRATGPWAIIEYDTPTHLIGIGRGGTVRGGAKLRRARVRVRGGVARGGYLEARGYKHGVTGPIVHPGTKGKLIFHKGVTKATPKATDALRKTTVTAVKEAFG